MNLADYSRYLCEVTLGSTSKEDTIFKTDKAYEKYFSLVEETGLQIVNPTHLTAHYHYSIFKYEILNKKTEAIKYLKNLHQKVIDGLDTAYKLFVDSYPLLDLFTDTLTEWVINTNYLKHND